MNLEISLEDLLKMVLILDIIKNVGILKWKNLFMVKEMERIS